jgi:hypothetical protein
MDVSHHLGHGVELEDHQLVHILATSTCVKVGSVPVISADFARCGVVTQMLKGWNSLFQFKKYIGLNFLTLYQRKNTTFILTHVKSGLLMRKVGHSHTLTICLVRCTTRHAPIGVYHSRFFPEESTACSCGFPMETVSHVLYQCPLKGRSWSNARKCVMKSLSHTHNHTHTPYTLGRIRLYSLWDRVLENTTRSKFWGSSGVRL